MTAPKAILDFEPDYDAPLPAHFQTGHPINAEPGIFVVYAWDYVGACWYAVGAFNVRDRAESFADELTGSLVRKGIRCCYRVEEGK